MVEGEGYKLEILEYAINQSIDRLLPNSSEDALNVILYQSNEVVWRVATEIYTKSGHQVDFVFIRNLLNLRIEPFRNKIAEKAKIKAELEAQRRIKEAEKENIVKEKQVEEARIKVKLETEKEKLTKQRKKEKQENLEAFCESYPNISIEVFLRIEKLITEELLLEEKQVITIDSILNKDLGADDLDIMELIQVIEKEFDIEIPDDFTGTNWISCICGNYSRLESITVKEIVDIVCEKIQ